MVPAFTGLGSPYWDPYARGTIARASPAGTNRAHLARAVVEAMAFQTRDVVDAMTAASGHRVRALRVDGGASVMPLLLQFQADQLGRARGPARGSRRPRRIGAAYLAGLAEGVWGDLDELAGNWHLDVEVDARAPTGPRPTPPTPRGSAPWTGRGPGSS